MPEKIRKITDALVSGKAMRIEGGEYKIKSRIKKIIKKNKNYVSSWR